MIGAGLPLVMPAMAMAGANYRTRELSRADMIWRSITAAIQKRDNHTCLGCQFRASFRMQVHHRDHNHTNNSPRNLATACCWCHAVQHPGFHGMEGRAYLLEMQIPTDIDWKSAISMVEKIQRELIRRWQRCLLEGTPAPTPSEMGLRVAHELTLVDLANDFVGGRRRSCIDDRATGRFGYLMGLEPWAFEEEVRIWKQSGNFSIAS